MSNRINFTTKQSIRYQVWDDAQCAAVVNAAYNVLETTGVVVRYEPALKLLVNAGCKVIDGRVKIPRSLVKKALTTAPNSVTIYDREGNVQLNLESGTPYFGPAMCDTNIYDVHTGERRPSVRTDVIDAARLCDALPNIDFASPMGEIADCTPGMTDVLEVYYVLNNTIKPFTFWSYGVENLKSIVELFETAVGGADRLRERPVGLDMICNIPPFLHMEDGLSQLIYMAEKELPCLYVCGATLGQTGPISVAGANVLVFADIFAGLVIHQLANPGAPFIPGKFHQAMDMANGNASYSRPEPIQALAAGADVFRYLNLPFASDIGLTDAVHFDQQAAFDLATDLYTGALIGCGVNMAMGVLECLNTTDFDALVYGDDIVGYIRKLIEGAEVSDETLAVDVIASAAKVGNFMSEPSTFAQCRSQWKSSVAPSLTYQQYNDNGEKDYGTLCHQKVLDILAKGNQRPLSADVIEKMDKIVEEAEARVKASR